jgi:hypothetical protein
MDARASTSADKLGPFSSGSCFGYTGNFLNGSVILEVNWFDEDRYECFGIAPGRTIWHTWPSSGGWYQMPHDGRADSISRARVNGTTRFIQVQVTSSGNYFCSGDPGNGIWGPWKLCDQWVVSQ